jgi:hypothetical protein
LSSIARAALDALGLDPAVRSPENFLHDGLLDSAIWPVYLEIAQRLGLQGDYHFKLPQQLCRPDRTLEVLDLQQFIDRSFACYPTLPSKEISTPRFSLQADLRT